MAILTFLLIAMSTGVSSGQDQNPTEIPRRVPGTRSSRLGAKQFELIRKSLKLNEEQTGKLNGLIETYKARVMEEAMALLGNIDEMREISSQLQAARSAGDGKRVKELELRARELRPETRPTNEFYESFSEVLDDRQKAQMLKLRVMLEGKGGLVDMRLKPRHVVRIAESLGLSREQSDAIRRLQDAFREKMRATPRNDENAKQDLMDQLVADIRAVLTDDQTAKYDAKVAER